MLFFRSVTEADWEPVDEDEWDAFDEWLEKQEDVDDFDRSTCEGFYQAWLDSPDYETYQMELKVATVLGDITTPHLTNMTGLTSAIARIQTHGWSCPMMADLRGR